MQKSILKKSGTESMNRDRIKEDRSYFVRTDKILSNKTKNAQISSGFLRDRGRSNQVGLFESEIYEEQTLCTSIS